MTAVKSVGIPMNENKYYDALRQCGIRYANETAFRIAGLLEEKKVFGDEHSDIVLDGFIYEFIDGVDKRLPLMKLNRWLGYIQGCLIERGYTTVEDERNFTRPLFRPLDFAND